MTTKLQNGLKVSTVLVAAIVVFASCGDKTKDAAKARTKAAGASSDATSGGASGITEKEQTGAISGVVLDSPAACLNHLLLGDIDINMALAECAADPIANNPAPVATVAPVVVATVTPTPTPTPSATPVAPPSNVVVFTLTPAVGTGAWNTKATAVQVKVGQILRIVNNDTIVHRMHTGGSPCPHGNNIAVGASADCTITSTIDTTQGNLSPVYAHGRPQATTPFYIISTAP